MRRSTKIRAAAIAGIAATGIALAGAGAALAHDNGDRGAGRDGGREGRPVVSERVVQQADGSFVTLQAITGQVTAVSTTSITVKAANGTTRTFAVTSATNVAKDAAASTIGSIAVGDTVHVHGVAEGSTATAQRILAGDRAAAGRGERGERGRHSQHGGPGKHGDRGTSPGDAPSSSPSSSPSA